MTSLTQWTWVWIKSRSWWWTGDGQSMGLQRVGHDWVTELNWAECTLILGPNIPGSYAILLFTALDFTSITSHIHNWVLFLLWLHLFILSGVISPLYWTPIGLECSSFSVLSFCLFIPFMGFSRREYWSGLALPSPVDHILSELSTMTRPSYVALHGMAHSFTEIDKAVVHVIRLVSFLCLWFSVCLPSDGEG